MLIIWCVSVFSWNSILQSTILQCRNVARVARVAARVGADLDERSSSTAWAKRTGNGEMGKWKTRCFQRLKVKKTRKTRCFLTLTSLTLFHAAVCSLHDDFNLHPKLDNLNLSSIRFLVGSSMFVILIDILTMAFNGFQTTRADTIGLRVVLLVWTLQSLSRTSQDRGQAHTEVQCHIGAAWQGRRPRVWRNEFAKQTHPSFHHPQVCLWKVRTEISHSHWSRREVPRLSILYVGFEQCAVARCSC